jgi:hypothetical protein
MAKTKRPPKPPKKYECEHSFKSRKKSNGQKLSPQQAMDVQKGILPEGGVVLCKFCRENAKAIKDGGIQKLAELQEIRRIAKL